MASHDDFSLVRVPDSAKQPMWKIAMLRTSGLCCLSMLMVGTILGSCMTLKSALLAIIFGSIVLQVVGWAVGTIAAREGLGGALVTRWAGFGRVGSTIVGLILGLLALGFFGILTATFAAGMLQATGIFNMAIWCIISGIGMTLIVTYGIKIMAFAANIALPLFLIGTVWCAVAMFAKVGIGAIASYVPAVQIPLVAGIVIVAGSYMTGALLTPDYARFVRNGKQVFGLVLISTLVGDVGVCLVGVMMALAVQSGDVVACIASLAGLGGVILLTASSVQICNISLYSSTMSINNFFNLIVGAKWNRAVVSLVIGIIGTILAVAGILNYFANILTIVGTYLPSLAAVIVTDYFFLKRQRKEFDEAREKNSLPAKIEIWNPMALIAWIAGGFVAQFVTWGIPSVNGIVVGGVLYFVLMKIYGAARGGNMLFKTVDTEVEDVA